LEITRRSDLPYCLSPNRWLPWHPRLMDVSDPPHTHMAQPFMFWYTTI
jgi:hypothetical protein